MNNYFGLFPLSTYYDQNSNYIIYNGAVQYQMIAGKIFIDNNAVTDFIPKTTFKSLDWGDKTDIARWGMPSNKYINLTAGVTGTTYTATTNGYFASGGNFTNAGNYVQFSNGDLAVSTTPGNYGYGQGYIYIPAKKGDNVIFYYNVGSLIYFRFFPCDGDV